MELIVELKRRIFLYKQSIQILREEIIELKSKSINLTDLVLVPSS